MFYICDLWLQSPGAGARARVQRRALGGSGVTHPGGARLQPSRDRVSFEAVWREGGATEDKRKGEEGEERGRKGEQGALFPWVVVPTVCPTSAVSYPSFLVPLKTHPIPDSLKSPVFVTFSEQPNFPRIWARSHSHAQASVFFTQCVCSLGACAFRARLLRPYSSSSTQELCVMEQVT